MKRRCVEAREAAEPVKLKELKKPWHKREHG